MNALMIALALRLGGTKILPVRVIHGALAGAAIARLTHGLPRIQAMLVWLPAAMVMMRIAQGGISLLRMLTGALLLMCAAGFAGGMVLALWGATGSLALAYVLGIGVSAVVCLCAVSKAPRPHDGSARIVCAYHGRQATFDAMIDSGNTLRDYLTHLPVIVIAETTGREALALDDAPLRPIFAQTAGGRQQMRAFSPQAVELEMAGTRRSVQAIIALSPQMSESVPALVPASLLGGDWNSNRGG